MATLLPNDSDSDEEEEFGPLSCSILEATTMCAWSKCYVGDKLKGCQLPGVQPFDICTMIGCAASFHHCSLLD